MAKETWRKLAESEARFHLMVELGNLEVGFPDVENFCLDLESNYRSTVQGELRDKGKKCPEYRIVKLCMNLKMIDELRVKGRLESNRYKEIRKIEDEYGKNSRRSRNIGKTPRKEAARSKVIAMRKN